jgi:hypothetical protein
MLGVGKQITMSRHYFDEKNAMLCNEIKRHPDLRDGFARYFVHLLTLSPPKDAIELEIELCTEINGIVKKRPLNQISSLELSQIKEKMILLNSLSQS